MFFMIRNIISFLKNHSLRLYLIVFLQAFLLSFSVKAQNNQATGYEYLFLNPEKEQCIWKYEVVAIKIRVMQDNMSVASRGCKDGFDYYKRVMEKYFSVFEKNNNILESVFYRLSGSSSKKELNKFVTNISNKASLKSTYNKEDFCDKYIDMMDDFLSLEVGELVPFVNKNIDVEISNPPVCQF